jgi:uncharacterized protein GlcG (DUF336 family)
LIGTPLGFRSGQQGGIPITVEGKVIGAIGASGNSPEEDEENALAGAALTATAVQEEGR